MGKIDFDKTNEAFRAGNRARKKESVQDTVESVDDIQAQIDRFEKQTGIKLEIRDGHPYFDGYLSLKNCTGLTGLPDGLKVGGNLDLEYCTRLTGLPVGLEVNGYLDLEGCTGLTSLPDGLKVRGNLDLTGCTGLTSLPTGLEVEGLLNLTGCTGLTGLPFDLVVQGDLIEHEGILTPFFKKLGIPVDKYGDTNAKDWNKWQKKHGYLKEAFRAGNRARKKESVQDNTDAVSKWRIPKKLETIDDWEAAFLLNTESVGITAAPRQSDSPSNTTRIYNLYVRSWENNSVTFTAAIAKTDFYSGDSPFGIMIRVIIRLGAGIGNISMHMVPAVDTDTNTSGRKIFTDLSDAMDSVYEIINYLRNSRHIGQVLKNPLILELDSSDITMIVVDEYLRSEAGCPLIWNQRIEYHDFQTDYESELRRAAAVRPWINWYGDTEVLAEAFKAGNRARKRESAADAADAGIDALSVCSVADRLVSMGFNIRCDKADYTEVRKTKPAEEIDSIIFNKWYTPSGKEPEGIIDESLLLIRGGYGVLNDKETGKKMPYISVELHADIKIDDKTVSRYRLSSLSSSWSDILNLTVFDKVDDAFLPKMNLLLRLFSDSDRILREIYGLLKDNILMLKVEQKTRKAYLHRILCRVMPEFGIWSYSSRFGGDLEVDPDSYAWEASGWIKIPETLQTPVNEAFRAGNRARKKETVQDTASDNVDPPIKFEDPNVEKICHEHGVFTISDAAEVETIQGWFEIDGGAGIDNPQIVKFNELQYFTGLTTIPVNAFLEQEKLEEIIIPDNVTEIGQCAFDSCRSLMRLVLPDRPVLELGSDCLQSCDGLDEVVVPSGWSGWRCIQEMKSAYEDELEWYQGKIDENHITEESSFDLLDARLNTFFINRQDTLDCRFSDLLDWWTGDDNPDLDPDDDEELSEAFRAGNRARKKEAAADSVESYGGLDDRNKCAEMMKTMLTSPECPAVRITGNQPAAIEDAPAIDPADIKISEHLQGSNQDYTLIVLKWEGVDQADPAQNLTYVTEISFSEATDGSGLLISGGCFGSDLADFSPLPEICIRADVEIDGKLYHRLWELCYVEDWETVDPDGMTYSKVSVNAIAAVAAAVRQLRERDRRKDPSSLGRYPVDEAFRAGNKARKKESAADSVEPVRGINVNNIRTADIARMFQGAISTTQALYRITDNDANPPFEPVFPMYMKWFIDLVASMYIRTTIPWPRNIRITDYDGLCSDDVNGQTFTIDADSIKFYDFHILILPGYDPNTYSVWRKDTIHLMDVKFKPEYPEQSEIVVKPACIYFVHDIIDSYRRFFKDKKVLDEAFRAGNRARKKESAADTVQDTDTFTGDYMPADKIIPNLFLSAVSTTHALLRTQGIINPPFKPEFPNYMKWFIDIITSMYIKTSISWQRRIWIMNVKGSPGRNNGQEFDINLEMGVRKYHFLITPGSKENQYAVWFKMTVHLFDIDFNPDYPERSKINIAPAMKYFIAGFLETYRMFFEEKGVLEAFRAGNQARKKESAQDAVNVVDTPVKFEDPVVRRYMEEHGITTVSKVTTAILPVWDADEQEDWLRPERFNEFKLFTSITHIEEYMFNGQENLEEIELPPTVQSIGYAAFRSCQSLENLDIPNSCREIGEDCLAGCDSLEYVGFPDSWTYDYAFKQFAKAFNDDIAYLPDTLADNDVSSWDEMPFPDVTITNNYYTFHLSDLFKNFGDQDALKAHGLLDEAFRAGNRARKKESAVDTVDSVDVKITKEEVAGWFRDAIESDRNTIHKNDPHAWPAMCLVNDVLFTRLAINEFADKIKESDSVVIIDHISHGQFRNPKGPNQFGSKTLGFVDVTAVLKGCSFSWHWQFIIAIEDYNKGKKDYCYKLYADSQFVNSKSLLLCPKNEPLVTVYTRRTPYEIEVNEKFVDSINRILE